MPEKLLTTREVVELLQLDRVTIYKMVKDGELPALRLGGQWRFSERALGEWLNVRRGEALAETRTRELPTELGELKLTDLVPIATLQAIQNQFSELLGVSSFITDLEGQPLAPCSRCSHFCQLVHTHPEGMEACQASWREIAQAADQAGATVHTCHAGIQYAGAPVVVNGRKMGMVTAGQFFTEPPDPDAFREQARVTGSALRVDGDALTEAMDSIELVSHERALQITNLLAAIANAISSIGYQSYQMHQTLAQIARLTSTAREAR